MQVVGATLLLSSQFEQDTPRCKDYYWPLAVLLALLL